MYVCVDTNMIAKGLLQRYIATEIQRNYRAYKDINARLALRLLFFLPLFSAAYV